MKKYKIGLYEVEIDEEKTKSWYETYDGWNCECGDCQNYSEVARKREFPDFYRDLLDMLNIPLEKATYVCKLFGNNNQHYYELSYRVAGNIISKESSNEDFEDVSCYHERYPYAASDFPTPHFDLRFYIYLPWILEELPK
jgi:hypothetical protein